MTYRMYQLEPGAKFYFYKYDGRHVVDVEKVRVWADSEGGMTTYIEYTTYPYSDHDDVTVIKGVRSAEEMGRILSELSADQVNYPGF